MWFAFCCFLLATLDVTATTQLRLPRGTSSTEGLILNSTDVVEVQLTPGSTSLKFEVCHKPKCRGTMLLWFSASGTDSSATQHNDGFCYLKHIFNILTFGGCADGKISDTKITFFRFDPTNNPCGINISDDRRLKVQLESLVEGCEIRVTNGAIWTETADRSNVKIALAVGIPIGIIVIIGVVTLLVIFVGRPWWKKRNSKKNRATAAASKNPEKQLSAAILPVEASPCALTSAPPQVSSVTSASSVPPASSAPLIPSALSPSSAPPVSLRHPDPSASLTPAASSVPSESTVSRKSDGPSTGMATQNRRQSRSSKQTNSNKFENSVYDIEYHPWK